MENKTKGWFTVAMMFLIGGAIIYGLMALTGGLIFLGAAVAQAGPGVLLLLLIPGLPLIGVGILIAKVIVDRVENKEDDYYSKNIATKKPGPNDIAAHNTQ
ncbi:MAG: hypothetical protein AAFX02_06220 [Pseudomonadota bacterium]